MTSAGNPLKRDSSWRMVMPGCYLDADGAGHLFPHEFLAFLSVAHPEAGFDAASKNDYDMVVKMFSQLLHDVDPEVRVVFVEHERNEN